jgi:hypothetical protein
MPRRLERSEVAAAILQYLAEHEQAADTAAGIARWWMGRDNGALSIDVVELALTDLVRAGLLEQRQLPDGTTIYRRAGRET